MKDKQEAGAGAASGKGHFVDWATLPRGSRLRACPMCARSPGDRTMGAAVLAAGIGCVCCFRCGFVEWRNHERKATAAEHEYISKRIAKLERQYVAQIQRNAHAAMIAVGCGVH